jgi:hypothetical protein
MLPPSGEEQCQFIEFVPGRLWQTFYVKSDLPVRHPSKFRRCNVVGVVQGHNDEVRVRYAIAMDHQTNSLGL